MPFRGVLLKRYNYTNIHKGYRIDVWEGPLAGLKCAQFLKTTVYPLHVSYCLSVAASHLTNDSHAATQLQSICVSHEDAKLVGKGVLKDHTVITHVQMTTVIEITTLNTT